MAVPHGEFVGGDLIRLGRETLHGCRGEGPHCQAMLEEEGLGVSVRIAQSPKRPNVMAVRVAGRGSPAIELHHKPTPEKLLRLHFPHPRNMHSGGTAQEHNHLMSANSNLRDADIHGDEQSRPIRRADGAWVGCVREGESRDRDRDTIIRRSQKTQQS